MEKAEIRESKFMKILLSVCNIERPFKLKKQQKCDKEFKASIKTIQFILINFEAIKLFLDPWKGMKPIYKMLQSIELIVAI